MALPSLSTLDKGKQHAIFWLAIGLLIFGIYAWFIASTDAKRFMGAYNIDKIAHFGGGIFLVLMAEWLYPTLRPVGFLAYFLMLTIGWEALEFFFHPDTQYFYQYFPDLWLIDSSGDIFLALLGSAGYWKYFRK